MRWYENIFEWKISPYSILNINYTIWESIKKERQKERGTGTRSFEKEGTEVGTPFQYFERNEERERVPLKGTVAHLCVTQPSF